MKKANRLGMIAVLAAGTVSAPALADSVTVGRFYTELAQVKHLASLDEASAEANLRSAGYKLPELALDKSLTEGDVMGISTAVGVAVTTQRPTQLFSEVQLNTYMAVFSSQLRAPSVGVAIGNRFRTNGTSQGQNGNNQGQNGNNQGQNNNNQGQDQGNAHSPSRP